MKQSTAAILIVLVIGAAAAIAYFFDKKSKAVSSLPATASPDAVATNADVLQALSTITFKIQ